MTDSPLPHSGTPRRPGLGRVILAIAGCAAAGAGLQGMRHSSPQATLAAENPGASPSIAAPAPKSQAAPTRESLEALSPADQITTLAAALPQMEIADLLPLVEHLLKARGIASNEPPADPFAAPPPDPISPLLRALFTRWAVLDAAGFMAYVESGPLRYDYEIRRLAVLALVEVRGLSALEEVRAKSPTFARQAAREMLIRQPGQLEALLPFLKISFPSRYDRDVDAYRDEIVAFAAVLSSGQFLRYAMEMDDPSLVDAALQLVYRKSSADEVLRLVKSLPPGTGRDNALTFWLSAGLHDLEGGTNTEAVFRREYEALEDGPVRRNLLGNYATLLGKENTEAAAAWAQTLTDPRQRLLAFLMIGRTTFQREIANAGELTRQLAAAWVAAPQRDIESLRPLMAGGGVFSPFKEWHRQDPAAAEAWLATVAAQDLRLSLLGQIQMPIEQLLRQLPGSTYQLQSAMRILFEQQTGTSRTSFTDPRVVPAEWREAARLYHLEKNLPGAAEWKTLTPVDRRALSAAAIRRQASGPTDYDPLQPSAAGEAAEPPFLLTFNSLPPEERSLGAYYEAGAAYIKRDEAAASHWLDSLPPGAERDAAATALVEHLVKPGDHQDGEAAFAWAAAMSGETERTRYTAEAARAWAAEDPAAARAAVEAAALPAAEKSALLQQLPPEGGAR